MTRHSVEAYNIYDKNGNVLYNGDVVLYKWGGGNERGRPYITCAYHQLYITSTGRLSMSGCHNSIYARDLVKIDPSDPKLKAHRFDVEFKEYM